MTPALFPLLIPPGLAGLSLVYLSIKYLTSSSSHSALTNEVSTPSPSQNDYTPLTASSRKDSTSLLGTLKELDGSSIFLFRFLRFSAVAGLLGLQVFDIISKTGDIAACLQLAFYAYLSLLCICTISASNPHWRDSTSRHLALLLFANFVVYSYLDVWPYATQTPHPLDPASDPEAWLRKTLLTLSAVVIPLIMPRPFRPLTPEAEPAENEVAPILSRVTYTYLDKIVFYAWRVPDIGISDMANLPRDQSIGFLVQQGLKYFDPVLLRKKRHAFFGYLDVWGYRLCLAVLWAGLFALSEFIGIFGTNNLLYYLETGISPYNMQPWVWMALLGLGPFITGCIGTQYLYSGTRILIGSQSLLNYLAFHHSIRIRLKSDVKGEKKGEKEVGVATGASSPSASDADSSRDADSESIPGGAASQNEPKPEGGQFNEQTGAIVGKINNLVTSDSTTIASSWLVVETLTTTMQVIIAIFVLYRLLSWSALVGFGILVILTPVPTHVGRLMAGVQKEKMEMTDKRVEVVTQSLNIIRMLKLFAWETYMLKVIAQHRLNEIKKMRKKRLLETLMNCLNLCLPLVAKVTTFSVYAVFVKGDLSASRLFSALMVFNLLEEQLYLVMQSLQDAINAKVSFDRFTEFFNETELLDGEKQKASKVAVTTLAEYDRESIGFSDCSFSWDSFDNPDSPAKRARKAFRLRFDGEVLFKRGQINLILGPTASGKTSVLMALLGEMYYKAHSSSSWYNLPREGGIAYAAQESWVLNETIRDNILFGEPFDEERYEMTLDHCALKKDLSLWEAGDQTEVGEKGLTLSGGQKARVTLARALYSHASIVLLDDVLAALDVHTAKWIVDKAFSGDLVKDRTVLLVTHNIALAAPIGGHVVLLGRHGIVAATGSVSDVLKKDSDLRAQMEKEREEKEEDVDIKADEAGKGGDEPMKKVTGKLVVAEEKALGRVEHAAFLLYIKAVGSPIVWAIFLTVLVVAILVSVGQTWFVGYWSSQYDQHAPQDIPVVKYLVLYALLNLLTVASDTLARLLWIFRSLRASRILHSRLLESVFTATFRWLDVTPVGRIITRCTQDISSVDQELESFAFMLMRQTIALLAFFISAVLMAGWYAFIPGFLLALFGGFLGIVYLKCQLCIRREMSNAKAPVMSEIGAALNGLASIRAFGAQEQFVSRIMSKIDVLSKVSYTFYDINRWIAVRIDGLSGIFAASVAAYLVYGGNLNAGQAGFTISVVLSFSRQMIWWVRIYNLLEIQANSLERILGFLRIEHEPNSSDKRKPPAYWPSSGSLRVEKLSARYSDDSPEVLKDLTFEIAPGERVGVVGRTGAGKSSVALALLRAIKTSGKVYYDNLATDEINLDVLRSNITLIPQQPELMHGTLRTNLDPFEQYDDASLHDALRVAGLFDIRDTAPASKADAGGNVNATGEAGAPDGDGQKQAKIGLDTMVESGGTNFSLGQRQIIALARAIVRRSKLLILDEATAAIDYETDAAIQKTLRTEFGKDTTFITIAHRLQTIMDYDKIMVLEAGKLVEFDTPKNLLQNEKGFLRALVDESDDKDKLFELANKV